MSTPVLPSRDAILAVEIKINKYHILSNQSTINYGQIEHVGLLVFSRIQVCPGLTGDLAGFPADTNRKMCPSMLSGPFLGTVLGL